MVVVRKFVFQRRVLINDLAQAIGHLISNEADCVNIFDKLIFWVRVCEASSHFASAHAKSNLDRVDVSMSAIIFMQNDDCFDYLFEIFFNFSQRQCSFLFNLIIEKRWSKLLNCYNFLWIFWVTVKADNTWVGKAIQKTKIVLDDLFERRL